MRQVIIFIAVVATSWDVVVTSYRPPRDTEEPYTRYNGLRVKFGWSDAMADKTHFFNIPRMIKDAEALGWKRIKQAAPELPELKMYCPPGRAVCPLYSPDGGWVAGLQLALLKSAFQPGRHFIGEKRMISWSPKDSDNPEDANNEYWTATQYFVSEESLKAGAGPAVRDLETLQDDAVWVHGPDFRLIRIPELERELNKTIYKRQNCIPSMGTHYYYNMTPALRCDRIEPWFVLVNLAIHEIIGTGFQVFGRLTTLPGQREWWENVQAPKQSAQITIPLGPPCIYDYAEAEGVVSMHIYYIKEPWVVTCRTGDSVKMAPFMDRLLLNSWRYASKISDQFKGMFN